MPEIVIYITQENSNEITASGVKNMNKFYFKISKISSVQQTDFIREKMYKNDVKKL